MRSTERILTTHTGSLPKPEDLIRLRDHEEDELSHYSSATADVEFLFPWGWDELENEG